MPPGVQIDAEFGTLIGAGLPVGVGIYCGADRTRSVVCDRSRLFLRLLVATVNFMAAGFDTVFVFCRLIPLQRKRDACLHFATG